MLLFVAALFPSVALAAAAMASMPSKRQSACQDVHLFLAGGNNEPYPGRLGAIVATVCSGLSSCDYEDIVFNHTLAYEYCASIYDGSTNGKAQVTAYNARCPNSKLVLAGFSQGGHVVGNIIGGGGGDTFVSGCLERNVTGLDSSTAPANKIAAVLLFGDPRHTANQSYNVESGSAFDSPRPRVGSALTSFNRFAAVLRSWCVVTDPRCAKGSDISTHLTYFDIYSNAAGVWAKSILAATAASSSSTASLSLAASATQSTTSSAKTSSMSSILGTSSKSSALSSTQTNTPTSVSSLVQSATSSSTSASAASTTTKASSAGSVICNISLLSLAMIVSLAL